MMQSRSIRTVLYLKIILRLCSLKCRRMRTTHKIAIRKYLLASRNSPSQTSTKTCSRPCLIIPENFLDSKINNRCLNKRPGKEDCQFPKYCLLRRRSCLRKPRKWLTSTHGSCLLTRPSVPREWRTLTVSCSLNLKSSVIKKQTKLFMRL